MTYLDVLIVFILLFLILPLWLAYIFGLSYEEAFDSIQKVCRNFWRHYSANLRVCQMRQMQYSINQDLTPFEREVDKLHVFKYFKFRNTYFCEKDLLMLVFETHGIANEHKDNIENLKALLEALLRDFYMQRLGCEHFPFVHVQHIQENETLILVSCNAYGNELILNRKEAERLNGRPNTEALTDD